MIYKFIEQRVGKIFKSSFLRNVLLVAGGTAGAQAITMLFVPIVTRLYGPEAFGVQGTFMAILSVLTPIAAFTYPIAMVLPKEDKHAIGLAKISIAICLAFSILLAILLFLLGDYLVNLLNIESIGAYLWLLPIAMVLSALHQILSQWLIRKKEFKQTAKAAIYQALTVNLTKVGFGLLSPLAIVLVVISAIANGIHALYLYLGLKKKEILVQAAYDLDTNRLATLDLAKKHKDFPLYRMPQVFLNAVSQSLPVLLLATFFGPASAGFYALSKTVMGLPSMLIGKSVSDVFYPKITEAAHKGESIKPLLMKATNAMALVGFIPFALIVFAGPILFSLAFGSDWAKAGEYGRWLAIWLFFGFMNRPSVAAIATLGLQRFFLWYELVSIALRVIGLYVGFFIFESDLLAVAIFSAVGAALNITLIIFTNIFSGKYKGI